MPQPFKFRYVNEIVGAFVLTTIALVVFSVILIALSKQWFDPNQNIVLKIPGGLSADIRPGADVVIGGTVAGSVEYANPDPHDTSATVANLSIPRNFLASIHRDSKIEIRRSLGGIGDVFVRISGGTGPHIPSGASITVIEKNIQANPAEQAQQMIRDVAVPMLMSITRLADGMNDADGNFQLALGHANHIFESVDHGQGVAGRLVMDPKLADQVGELLPKVDASLERLRLLLADTQKTTAQLPQMATSLNQDLAQVPELLAELRGGVKQIDLVLADIQKTTGAMPQTVRAVNQTMEMIPGVVLQTQETLHQLQRLVEAAQKSWLLRGSVEPEPPAGSRVQTDRIAQ